MDPLDKAIEAVANGAAPAKVLQESAVYTYYYVDYDDPPPKPRQPYSLRSTTEAKWMQKLKLKKGALTKQAQSAGETVSQFCAGKHTGTTAKRCSLAKTFKKAKHESYDEYLSRYEAKTKSGAAVGPLLSSQDHALAVRVLTRLSEAHRDPVRVRELRERLLLSERQMTGA